MSSLRRHLATLTVSLAVHVVGLGTAVARPQQADHAQDPGRQSPALVAQEQEPEREQQRAADRVAQSAEPDFRLINLPTTMRLPEHRGNFALTHRFNGNLRLGTFGDQAGRLFGIDEGATVGFEYRFGVMRHVEAAAYRNTFQRTVQFYSKWDAVHQHGSRPVSLSGLISVEGIDNFRTDHASALGAVVYRPIGETAAVYAVPMWVHNSAASLDVVRETFYTGVGGRLRVRPTVYLVGEVSPRLAGYAPGQPEFGFGIEKRVGRHVFQLNFTNSFGTTFGQIARGGTPDSLYMGFNLARKFF